MPRPARSIASLAALAAALAASPALAGGVTEKTLHTFDQSSTDANFPSTGLVMDADGNLFGGTHYGGTSGNGTIFEVSPPGNGAGTWTGTVIHNFAGGTDGSNPTGGLAVDAKGNLYGTTSSTSPGAGSVFELVRATAWTKVVLHQFTGSDGTDPVGTLLRDKSGNLYGATFSGGGGLGSVYRLSPDAAAPTGYTFTELHAFNATTDGFGLYAGVIEDAGGNLYGTTSAGGPAGSGTVYRLNRPKSTKGTWTLTVLHPFGATGDGKGPAGGLLLDSAGNVYGTTASGGSGSKGTVWEVSPPTSAGGAWGYTILLNFTGLNGASPANSNVVADAKGNLWGTTTNGGSSNAWGAVFELSPSGAGWRASVPFSFGGSAGSFPGYGLIIDKKGHLYGTNMSNDVFEVTP